MSRRLRLGVGLAVILGLVALAAVWQANPGRLGVPRFAPQEGKEAGQGFYTLFGPGGEVLLETARSPARGDLFIAADNRCFEVVRTWGRRAHARELPAEAPGATAPFQAIPLGAVRPVVVVYHSHSSESYIPTDGDAFTPGNGSILEVGRLVAVALEGVNFVAVHDTTRHDPHDALAYVRSARTVIANQRHRPALLFDIHRDAAPARAYQTKIDGQIKAQVLLVVGRQNPLRSVNLRLAKRLKAVGDELYPGLIKGIFHARGHYNQHLDPGALLLEVGTAHQPREEADRTTPLLAAIIARALGPAR